MTCIMYDGVAVENAYAHCKDLILIRARLGIRPVISKQKVHDYDGTGNRLYVGLVQSAKG